MQQPPNKTRHHPRKHNGHPTKPHKSHNPSSTQQAQAIKDPTTTPTPHPSNAPKVVAEAPNPSLTIKKAKKAGAVTRTARLRLADALALQVPRLCLTGTPQVAALGLHPALLVKRQIKGLHIAQRRRQRFWHLELVICVAIHLPLKGHPTRPVGRHKRVPFGRKIP